VRDVASDDRRRLAAPTLGGELRAFAVAARHRAPCVCPAGNRYHRRFDRDRHTVRGDGVPTRCHREANDAYPGCARDPVSAAGRNSNSGVSRNSIPGAGRDAAPAGRDAVPAGRDSNAGSAGNAHSGAGRHAVARDSIPSAGRSTIRIAGCGYGAEPVRHSPGSRGREIAGWSAAGTRPQRGSVRRLSTPAGADRGDDAGRNRPRPASRHSTALHRRTDAHPGSDADTASRGASAPAHTAPNPRIHARGAARAYTDPNASGHTTADARSADPTDLRPRPSPNARRSPQPASNPSALAGPETNGSAIRRPGSGAGAGPQSDANCGAVTQPGTDAGAITSSRANCGAITQPGTITEPHADASNLAEPGTDARIVAEPGADAGDIAEPRPDRGRGDPAGHGADRRPEFAR
jgi:hypothetical protein